MEACVEQDTGDAVVYDLLFTNCDVATMAGTEGYGMIEGGAVGVIGGKIAYVGGFVTSATIKSATCHKDMKGKLLTPGLIDCHTHIVYGGDRAEEWEMKIKGATYEEVAKAGGGIVNTVDGTRTATVDDLVEGAKKRVEALLKEGVTTLEIKSGYGLEIESERKMLLAAKELSRIYGIAVEKTFLAAHAVPREFEGRPDEYITECLKMMETLAGEGLIDCVDAFCESIGFTVEQTTRVFVKAKELNLQVRLHGDQLNDFGGGELAAKFGALSCDHCEYAGDEAIQAMSDGKVVAVLLPTANYFINETRMPPIDKFRAKKVDIAIATNCNPGSSPCCSLLLVMNMACTRFRMSPAEALRGVTCNAAKAIGRSGEVGSIEVGKTANLAVWGVGKGGAAELAYYMGLNQLDSVYVNGNLKK